MAAHNDLGKKGEELATIWLAENGYEILHHNWRHGFLELDIIARQGSVYHFIEIKAGHAGPYGRPEERIGKKKIRHMMKAASAWLYQNRIPAHTRVQYDVLAITMRPDTGPEYFLTTDVYC